MIKLAVAFVGSSPAREASKSVEVKVCAYDPDAPKGSNAREGTNHTFYFPDRAAATADAIRTLLNARQKDGEGNDIVGTSPKEVMITWVKRERGYLANPPRDLTPKREADRELETVSE